MKQATQILLILAVIIGERLYHLSSYCLPHNLDKIGHILMGFIISKVIFNLTDNIRIAIIFSALYICLDEYSKSILIDHRADPYDALADCLGIGITILSKIIRRDRG